MNEHDLVSPSVVSSVHTAQPISTSHYESKNRDGLNQSDEMVDEIGRDKIAVQPHDLTADLLEDRTVVSLTGESREQKVQDAVASVKKSDMHEIDDGEPLLPIGRLLRDDQLSRADDGVVLEQAGHQEEQAVVDVPPLVAPVDPPLTNAQKIARIKELAQETDSDRSTQEKLKDILTLGKELGEDYEIRIDSVLDKNNEGQYRTETFFAQSRPDDTYYKISVSYEIEIMKKAGGEDDGVQQEDLSIPSIKREIYTTSKTPEGAIVAANDFAKTVIHLAKRGSNSSYNEGFDDYPDDALKLRAFRFNYNYDNGRPTRLLSIESIEKDKKEIKMTAKKENEYFYYRDLGTNETKRSKRSEMGDLKGKAIYGSEIEALLEASYVVSDDSIYERIEGSKAPAILISEIKEGIKKREVEIETLKAIFVKQGLLQSGKMSEGFQQFLLDVDRAAGNDIPEENLSPGMKELIGLENMLAQGLVDKNALEEDQDKLKELQVRLHDDPLASIDQDTLDIIEMMIRTYDGGSALEPAVVQQKLEWCLEMTEMRLNEFDQIEKKVKAAKDVLVQKHKEFYNGLVALKRGTALLQSELDRLILLREGAANKMTDVTATEEALQKASAIFEAVTEKDLGELKKSISASESIIDKIQRSMLREPVDRF